MKKYLMMGLATLAFAACVSDKEVTPQTQEEKYEKAFEQLVGGPINANVNWGFNAQKVATFNAEGEYTGMRSHDKNNNLWGGYVEVPDSINQAIRNKVMEYFNNTENPEGVAVNWSDFFVQQVGNTDRGPRMNYMYCGNLTEHINDFNGGLGGGKRNVGVELKPGSDQQCIELDYYDGITLMTNSSTEYFAFHNSYDDTY